MKFKNTSTIAALGLLSLALAAVPGAARDLTIASWGGNFQDAQREIYFKPFSKVTGKPLLDEGWDGGIGVLQAKVKAGNPSWDAVEVEADELSLGC
ncbi:ABC transporter substrate-binding protein, partial [Pseudomonas sp. BGM005]|nr:ABC transporter substrate-binding protein [Pseudomonas sp. BG5]